MSFKRIVSALPILALAAWLAPAPADAASAKGVQQGTVTMSATTMTVGSPTFSAVDPTKSFIVCSSRNTTSNAAMNATCELTGGGTTLTFTNNYAGTTAVQWPVVEFDGGVSLQRGLASFSTTDLTKTVTIRPDGRHAPDIR